MSSTTNNVGIVMSMVSQSTAAVNVSSVANIRQNGDKAMANFGIVLNQVTDSVMQSKNFEASSNSDQNAVNANAARQETNTEVTGKGSQDVNQVKEVSEDATKQVDTTATKETKDTEVNTKLQEAISEDGKELISKIAETFDLSEEDIINAMQNLGLLAADLLNPDNLQMVVTTAVGQDASLDLITDSDIYTSLQDLLEGAEDMKSQLMNEFDLSEEELQTAINNSKENFSDFLSEESLKEPEIIVNEAGEEITSAKDALLSKNTSDLRSDVISENAEIEEYRPVQETSNKSGSNNSGNLNGQAESSNLFNQLVNNITEAAQIDPTSTVSYTDRAQMENIIKQITDRITITRGDIETSMELQLHPASLGNVNILLTSSKDGIVAKFTAQNEIVKEAVESQMTQLQQKFEERGIKVTSVEVTIESHAFEQNLSDQNQRQGYEENTSNSKSKKGLRRINLSQIEDVSEIPEMDEDEKLSAQMMAVNGNTVDFSA